MKFAMRVEKPTRIAAAEALGAYGVCASGSTRWDEVVPARQVGPRPAATEGRPASGASGAAQAAPARAVGAVAVQVRLFGMRLPPTIANPLHLEFEGGCTLRDVLARVGERLGEAVLRNLVDEGGQARPTCRVFLEGEMTDDMAQRLAAGPRAAAVEVILLREIEGG